MTVYELVVWTRCRADSSKVAGSGAARHEAVWRRVADPTAVSAALPAPFTWELPDVEGFTAALRAGRTGPFPSRVVTPLGAIPWPLDLREVAPGLRFTTHTSNAWFRRFVHRRRVERAIGGRVRLVDEVVLEPGLAVAPIAVRVVERVLRHVQASLARDLDPEPTQSRRLRLAEADLDHAEALLGGIDLGDPP